MKRIFLTSGLVLCMACPAMAYVSAGNEQCVDSNIGVSTGSTNLIANWANNYATINLNVNSANGAAADSSVNPTPLYTVSDIAAVWTAFDDNNNLVDANKVTTGNTVLTTPLPTGKTVTYTNLNTNVPANTSALTSSNNSATTPARAFKGFYTVATGGTEQTQTITSGGALTSVGAGATTSGTWYAQYDCATPTLPSPTRAGYTFNGWYTAATGGDQVTATCLENDYTTALYAHWTAQPTTITFDCNTISGHHTGDPTGSTTQNINMDAQGNITATCSLTGWTFTGWDCGAGLTTDAAGENSVTTIAADALANTGYSVYMKSATDITCSATWEANKIGITYDSAGGSEISTEGENAYESCTYDGTVVLPTAPTRTGYTFQGWTVSNN